MDENKTTAAVGVNVSDKRKDITKLLYKACGNAIRKYNYDFDDVFQEVCVGILIRNNGAGAYDPSRSSFSHYIMLVCNSVFRNYHMKESKKRSRETIGLRNELGEFVDASEMAVEEPDEFPELSEESDLDKYLDLIAEKINDQRIAWEIKTNKSKYKKILTGVIAGFSKGEISKNVGVSRPKMHKIFKKYQKAEENSSDNGILDLLTGT